jgi:hypothetical protein
MKSYHLFHITAILSIVVYLKGDILKQLGYFSFELGGQKLIVKRFAPWFILTGGRISIDGSKQSFKKRRIIDDLIHVFFNYLHVLPHLEIPNKFLEEQISFPIFYLFNICLHFQAFKQFMYQNAFVFRA